MTTAGQSLFHVHHAAAKRASRRLSLYFWTGVLLSAFAYAMVAQLLIYLFLELLPLTVSIDMESDGEIANVGGNIRWYVAAGMAAVPIFTMVSAYFDERRRLFRTNAVDLAKELGARALKLNQHFNEQRLRNIVIEMAVASGIDAPEVLVLPKDSSINAFVIGGAERSLALAVSQGALDYLNREELQALVGHEFGHIINEDVFIYSKLSAMLHGYFIISEWRSGPVSQISSSRLQLLGSSDEDGISVYHLFMGFLGYLLLIVGQKIQSAFSREREWMADAKSVEYTRNSNALVSLFKKALALQHLGLIKLKYKQNVSHSLFINYQQRNQFWSQQKTHPKLEDRMRRYGGHYNHKEIEALAYELKKAQRQASTDDTKAINQKAFLATTFYPILTILNYKKQAKETIKTSADIDVMSAIFAFFVYHCGLTPFELTHSKHINQQRLLTARPYFSKMANYHPLMQLQFFTLLLDNLATIEKSALSTLIKEIKTLIVLDKDFSVYEWCYWVMLRHKIQPPVSGVMHYRELNQELNRLFSFYAYFFDDNKDKQAMVFSNICQQVIPVANANYHPPEMGDQLLMDIHKDIRRIYQLEPKYRRQISAGLEKVFADVDVQSLAGSYIHDAIIFNLR